MTTTWMTLAGDAPTRGALALLAAVVVKGSALLAAGAATAWLLRRSSAAVRHLAWAAALVGVVLVPLLGAVLPRWSPVALPAPAPAVLAPAASDAAASGVRSMVEDRSPTGILKSGGDPALPGRGASVSRIEIPASPVISPAPASLTVVAPRREIPWATVVVALWLAGAVVVALRLVVAWLRVRVLAARAEPEDDPEWLALFQRAVRTVGIGRPVRLLRSGRACVPMTWGTVYPVVLLPPEADDWGLERRRAVLTHELAHVARCDATTQLAAQLALMLLWFHPLAWRATRAMRRERELACDDLVLASGARATDYARDLLEVVQLLPSPRATAAAAFAMARPSEFEGRLLAILDPRVRRAPATRRRALLAVAITLGVVLPLAAFAPVWATEARAAAGSARVAGDEARASEVAVDRGTTHPLASPARLEREPAASFREVMVGAVPPASVIGRVLVEAFGTPTSGASVTAAASSTISGSASASSSGTAARAVTVGDTTPPARPVDRETLIMVAQGAKRITSDAEKGELLRTIAARYERDDALRDAYLDAVASITSDYEKSATLSALLHRDSLPTAAVVKALAVAGTIASDNDRATVLTRLVAQSSLAEPAVRDAFMAVVKRMSSDSDRGGVLRAVVRRADASPAVLVDVLRTAAVLASSTEKADVLLAVARRGALSDDAVRRAYADAAATVSSDYDYRRVMTAAAGTGVVAPK